ncbi:glycosyltransferase [Nocardioides sp. NPDC087217]|uniref:glycosyltransferase n=1 Tax=Nocardioides sp. NPDC087217 TaxID=3364335 RepID=UPI00382C4743
MSELSRLAVVVVSYGDPALLERHTTQVAAALGPARIVVVDNHSTDAHRDAVRQLCDRGGWTGVFPGTNTGFGAGCNLGAAAALADGAEVLLFLNPDATIDAESAVRLMAAVEAEPLLLAGPTVLGPDGEVASAGLDLDLDTGAMRPWRRRTEHPEADTLPWVTGACIAVTRELWERLSGFDERYFLYWEDVDLCARVQALGGRVAVIDGATAIHSGGGTQRLEGSRAKSPAYYYFNIRNRALFARTWLSQERQQAWRRGAFGAAYEILMRGGRRQLLHPVRPVSAVLRGLRDGRRDRPVRVLESARELRATTNPYIVQLIETLDRRDDTEVVLFGFARAIVGRYDVFHVHWPELLLTSARTPLRRLARRLLTTAFITRLRLTRTPVVRTWHNLVRPNGLSRWDHRLLDALERRTRHVIRLTDQTAPPLDVPTSTIVHAHYRDWFEPVIEALEPIEPVDSRVLYFGLIKPYKGVEQLLEAIADSPEAELDVRLVGSPSDPALADRVRAAAAADARISADLSYADDPTLAAEIAAATLVVLPYKAMHNSGALLLALSLDTPVLAPDNEVNRRLAEEVGEGWLHLFEGTLTIEDLERALKAVTANPPAGRPDLSAREWPESAALHAAAFRVSLYP